MREAPSPGPGYRPPSLFSALTLHLLGIGGLVGKEGSGHRCVSAIRGDQDTAPQAGGERRGLCQGRCGVAGVKGSGFSSSLWGDPAGSGSPWPIPDTVYQTGYDLFESLFFV